MVSFLTTLITVSPVIKITPDIDKNHIKIFDENVPRVIGIKNRKNNNIIIIPTIEPIKNLCLDIIYHLFHLTF